MGVDTTKMEKSGMFFCVDAIPNPPLSPISGSGIGFILLPFVPMFYLKSSFFTQRGIFLLTGLGCLLFSRGGSLHWLAVLSPIRRARRAPPAGLASGAASPELRLWAGTREAG